MLVLCEVLVPLAQFAKLAVYLVPSSFPSVIFWRRGFLAPLLRLANANGMEAKSGLIYWASRRTKREKNSLSRKGLTRELCDWPGGNRASKTNCKYDIQGIPGREGSCHGSEFYESRVYEVCFRGRVGVLL